MAEERLQKILSQAGVASRRHAEQLMAEGRVVVNGSVITQLGSKADFERDHIKVDGRLLRPPKHLVYIALHKPTGTVSTVSDNTIATPAGHAIAGTPKRRASANKPATVNAATAAKDKYILWSAARSAIGMKLEVGIRIMKNHAPAKPGTGLCSHAQMAAANKPPIISTCGKTSPIVRAAGQP